MISTTARSQIQHTSTKSITHIIGEVCLMGKRQQQCGVSLLEQPEKEVDWVQCSTCHGWYHCICVGIAPLFFQGGWDFFCCKTPVENPMCDTPDLYKQEVLMLILPFYHAVFCSFHPSQGSGPSKSFLESVIYSLSIQDGD